MPQLDLPNGDPLRSSHHALAAVRPFAQTWQAGASFGAKFLSTVAVRCLQLSPGGLWRIRWLVPADACCNGQMKQTGRFGVKISPVSSGYIGCYRITQPPYRQRGGRKPPRYKRTDFTLHIGLFPF
jgi:hypothetical protein